MLRLMWNDSFFNGMFISIFIEYTLQSFYSRLMESVNHIYVLILGAIETPVNPFTINIFHLILPDA